MPPKYKRRDVFSRFKDCGRVHETSSEASWNSSTIPEYSLPEHSTKRLSDAMKLERANRYDAPGAVPFTDWVQEYFKADSTGGSESGSKLEAKSWHETTASSSKQNGRKPKSGRKSQTPSTTMGTTKVELRGRRALHKKEWNMTTMLTWRNTHKPNQFQYILDSRMMPNLRNDKYKNVRPQYMNPRKRFDIFPPKKKKRRPKPLVFPPAEPCRCDKEPKSFCPTACPVSAILPGCLPLDSCMHGSQASTSDGQQPTCCLAAFGRSLDDSTPGSSFSSPGSAIHERPGPSSDASSVTSASPKSLSIHGKVDDDALSTISQGRVSSEHDSSSTTLSLGRAPSSPKSKDTTSSLESAPSTPRSKASTHESSLSPKASSACASVGANNSPDSSSLKSQPTSDLIPSLKASSDFKPTASSDDEINEAALARTRASLGFLRPPPGHDEFKAKSVANAIAAQSLWLNPGICRMRFPFLACLGELGAEVP